MAAMSRTPIYGRYTTETNGVPKQMVTNADIMLDEGLQVLNSSAVTIYLGDSAVTTGTGFPLIASAGFFFPVRMPSILYFVMASGSIPNVAHLGV
jgi:hypothetical protein